MSKIIKHPLNNGIAFQDGSLEEEMEDWVPHLTKTEKKIFNEWFKSDSKEEDIVKQRLIEMTSDFLKEHNNFALEGVIVPRSIMGIFIIREMWLDNVGTFEDEEFEKEFFDTYLEDSQIDIVVKYLRYTSELAKYALVDFDYDYYLMESKAVQDYYDRFEIQLREKGVTGGECWTPSEWVNQKLTEGILEACVSESSVLKRFKKDLEQILSNFLGIKSYKMIGLKNLSISMEKYLNEFGTFSNLKTVDRGIIAIVFALMTFNESNLVPINSCYMDWLELVDEQQKNKSQIVIDGKLKYKKDPLMYVTDPYHIQDLMEELSQKAMKEENETIQNYEMLMKFFGKPYGEFIGFDYIVAKCFIPDCANVIIFFSIVLSSAYEVSEWEEIPFETRINLVAQFMIYYQLSAEILFYHSWVPTKEELMEDSGTNRKIIPFHEKTSTIKKKNKSVYKTALQKKDIEIEELERRLKKEQEKRESLNQQIQKLRKENKQMRSSQHKKELEIRQLQKDLSEKKLSEGQQEELYRLREFAFNITKEMEIVDDEENIEEIIKKAGSIVLIGGHTTLYRKLEKKYSNIRCIDGRKRIGYEIVKGANYVFFLFDFISHSTYQQGCNACEEYEVPFGYIKGTNLEKAELQMSRYLEIL